MGPMGWGWGKVLLQKQIFKLLKIKKRKKRKEKQAPPLLWAELLTALPKPVVCIQCDSSCLLTTVLALHF